jgi:hypothetical protein
MPRKKIGNDLVKSTIGMILFEEILTLPRPAFGRELESL